MIFLLFLLLPSQLAFHFWPSWSLINGIRVDYLSPTLYLTDLIILGLFLASRLRVRVPLPVILFVVLNLLISYSPLVSLYKWLRILEYFWLFKYLVNYYELKTMNYALALSILWTSLLAWWQFFLQHSVGGLWWWLGERPLSAVLSGIAKVSFWDVQLMRPYATLPHPNALAGFLLVAGLILYSLNRKATPAVIIAFLTIPLTFSRTAIFLEVVILLFWLRPKILKLVLLVSSIYYLVSIVGSSVSVPDRLSLIHNSLFLIPKHPVLGVGLGSFIPATMNYELLTINYLYQPVHNIYLLLASELGIPAVVTIGYWLLVRGKQLLRTMNYELITAVAVIAITGAADHYWLTLHQNTLLLVLLLSLLYAKPTQHLLRRGSQR